MRDSVSDTISYAGRVQGIEVTPVWRRASIAIGLALAWIVAWYWTTGAAMVDIWTRSETFAHGFVVPPIVAWLVWRHRTKLLAALPRPNAWFLVPIAAAGAAWLLGGMVAVNSVTQAAMVAMLVLAVPAVLGSRAARVLAFPLGFLFFAVPVGEFMMPQLMAWTADFTVSALRLSGIPVLREGQQFVIPTGRWSVVEACSGIRYLIASVMVGTLYAHLTYRSLSRQLVFVGVSLVVPIVANWMRAYIIVMLGHLSGNRIAAGVDHIIYGWLFFGLVIMLMFWVGSRWREDDKPSVRPPSLRADLQTAVAAAGGPTRFWPVVLAIAMVTSAWPIAQHIILRDTGEPDVRLGTPEVAGWLRHDGALTDWEPRFLNASTTVHSTYLRDGRSIGVYVGYYRNQNTARKLVSSDNVLVHSNNPTWAQVPSSVRSIAVAGVPIDARVSELLRVNGQRLTVVQWYWVAGHRTQSDAAAKLWNAWSRLVGKGDDAAVVIVYGNKPANGDLTGTLETFLGQAMPAIDSALRAAWEKR